MKGFFFLKFPFFARGLANLRFYPHLCGGWVGCSRTPIQKNSEISMKKPLEKPKKPLEKTNEHRGALRGTPGSAYPQPEPNATELPSSAPGRPKVVELQAPAPSPSPTRAEEHIASAPSPAAARRRELRTSPGLADWGGIGDCGDVKTSGLP